MPFCSYFSHRTCTNQTIHRGDGTIWLPDAGGKLIINCRLDLGWDCRIRPFSSFPPLFSSAGISFFDPHDKHASFGWASGPKRQCFHIPEPRDASAEPIGPWAPTGPSCLTQKKHDVEKDGGSAFIFGLPKKKKKKKSRDMFAYYRCVLPRPAMLRFYPASCHYYRGEYDVSKTGLRIASFTSLEHNLNPRLYAR